MSATKKLIRQHFRDEVFQRDHNKCVISGCGATHDLDAHQPMPAGVAAVTLTDIDLLAERLFRADNEDPHDTGYFPFHRRARLSDLWPVDQMKYRRMAEIMLKERADG